MITTGKACKALSIVAAGLLLLLIYGSSKVHVPTTAFGRYLMVSDARGSDLAGTAADGELVPHFMSSDRDQIKSSGSDLPGKTKDHIKRTFKPLTQEEVDRIERMALFVGYGRSCHTIIGRMLDEHQNVIISRFVYTKL